MKNLFLIVAAATMMFACSKNDPASSGDGDLQLANQQVFDLSAVNVLNTNMAKSAVYSSEAVQHVTRVTIYAFVSNAGNYTFSKSYTVSGWGDGTTFKRFVVPESDKLGAGDYKFLVVGQNATDKFTVTVPTSTTKFEDMAASIVAIGDESEIFAGSSQAQVLSQGTRVTVTMTRQVAGVLGYFKNVPQMLDNKTVQYLRLSVNNSNKHVNLSTSAGSVPTSAEYVLFNIDLSTQSVSSGIYTGNDLSSVSGLQKLPNSQLGGAYLLPVGAITMTVGLYDNTNALIRSWTVQDGGNSTFDLKANHFYSLGKKVQTGSTNGGTPDPGDDDQAIDLLVDQVIAITINPAWSVVDDLVIIPTPLP